jgi:hypothetical protein
MAASQLRCLQPANASHLCRPGAPLREQIHAWWNRRTDADLEQLAGQHDT